MFFCFASFCLVLKYLHGAVRPLLMADKVVGGEHHLANIAVKTRFVPILNVTKKK